MHQTLSWFVLLTQNLVKSEILQVDAALFKQWYLQQRYSVEIGRKKKSQVAAKKEGEITKFGYAVSEGGRGIERVTIFIDGDKTWMEASTYQSQSFHTSPIV